MRMDLADFIFGLVFSAAGPFLEIIADGNGKTECLYNEIVDAERAVRRNLM